MLNNILDSTGRLHLLPASAYASIPKDDLRVWCHKHARYGLPTSELIGWLKIVIAGRTVLEIGAGQGDLGFHLGIPMTDSFQQIKDKDTALAFALAGQVPTRPPADVICEDAETAVRHYKPRVVIGSWITQRWQPGDSDGNMHGPREEYILDHCETYIHIGNVSIHRNKRLLNHPHWHLPYRWLVSRAAKPDLNCIYLWNNPAYAKQNPD